MCLGGGSGVGGSLLLGLSADSGAGAGEKALDSSGGRVHSSRCRPRLPPLFHAQQRLLGGLGRVQPKLIKSPWVGAPGRGEGGAAGPAGTPPRGRREGSGRLSGGNYRSPAQDRAKLARTPCGVVGTIPGLVIRRLASLTCAPAGALTPCPPAKPLPGEEASPRTGRRKGPLRRAEGCCGPRRRASECPRPQVLYCTWTVLSGPVAPSTVSGEGSSPRSPR